MKISLLLGLVALSLFALPRSSRAAAALAPAQVRGAYYVNLAQYGSELYREASITQQTYGLLDLQSSVTTAHALVDYQYGVSNQPAIAIRAQAFGDPNEFAYAGGGIALSYYYTINGPAGPAVPVTVNAASSLFVGQDGTFLPVAPFTSSHPRDQWTVQTSLSIVGTGFNISRHSYANTGSYSSDIHSTSPSQLTGGFTVNGTYLHQTNTPYYVQMYVGVGSAVIEGRNGLQTSGWVDPSFQIALDDESASLYSISYSPGIGDAPGAVPDVSTPVLLFALSIVAMGVFRRQTR